MGDRIYFDMLGKPENSYPQQFGPREETINGVRRAVVEGWGYVDLTETTITDKDLCGDSGSSI